MPEIVKHPATPAAMRDPAAALAWMLSGRAEFAATSARSGITQKFLVRKHPVAARWYVSQRGRDLCIITGSDVEIRTRPDDLALRSFLFIYRALVAGSMPAGAELRHVGRCGDCHRSLHDDVSRMRGYGPLCWSRKPGDTRQPLSCADAYEEPPAPAPEPRSECADDAAASAAAGAVVHTFEADGILWLVPSELAHDSEEQRLATYGIRDGGADGWLICHPDGRDTPALYKPHTRSIALGEAAAKVGGKIRPSFTRFSIPGFAF